MDPTTEEKLSLLLENFPDSDEKVVEVNNLLDESPRVYDSSFDDSTRVPLENIDYDSIVYEPTNTMPYQFPKPTLFHVPEYSVVDPCPFCNKFDCESRCYGSLELRKRKPICPFCNKLVCEGRCYGALKNKGKAAVIKCKSTVEDALSEAVSGLGAWKKEIGVDNPVHSDDSTATVFRKMWNDPMFYFLAFMARGGYAAPGGVFGWMFIATMSSSFLTGLTSFSLVPFLFSLLIGVGSFVPVLAIVSVFFFYMRSVECVTPGAHATYSVFWEALFNRVVLKEKMRDLPWMPVIKNSARLFGLSSAMMSVFFGISFAFGSWIPFTIGCIHLGSFVLTRVTCYLWDPDTKRFNVTLKALAWIGYNVAIVGASCVLFYVALNKILAPRMIMNKEGKDEVMEYNKELYGTAKNSKVPGVKKKVMFDPAKYDTLFVPSSSTDKSGLGYDAISGISFGDFMTKVFEAAAGAACLCLFVKGATDFTRAVSVIRGLNFLSTFMTTTAKQLKEMFGGSTTFVRGDVVVFDLKSELALLKKARDEALIAHYAKVKDERPVVNKNHPQRQFGEFLDDLDAEEIKAQYEADVKKVKRMCASLESNGVETKKPYSASFLDAFTRMSDVISSPFVFLRQTSRAALELMQDPKMLASFFVAIFLIFVATVWYVCRNCSGAKSIVMSWLSFLPFDVPFFSKEGADEDFPKQSNLPPSQQEAGSRKRDRREAESREHRERREAELFEKWEEYLEQRYGGDVEYSDRSDQYYTSRDSHWADEGINLSVLSFEEAKQVLLAVPQEMETRFHFMSRMKELIVRLGFIFPSILKKEGVLKKKPSPIIPGKDQINAAKGDLNKAAQPNNANTLNDLKAAIGQERKAIRILFPNEPVPKFIPPSELNRLPASEKKEATSLWFKSYQNMVNKLRETDMAKFPQLCRLHRKEGNWKDVPKKKSAKATSVDAPKKERKEFPDRSWKCSPPPSRSASPVVNNRGRSRSTSPKKFFLEAESLTAKSITVKCCGDGCFNRVQAPLNSGKVYCVFCHSLIAKGEGMVPFPDGPDAYFLTPEGLNPSNQPCFVDKLNKSIVPLYTAESTIPVLNGTKIGNFWVTASHHQSRPLFFDRECSVPLGSVVHKEGELEIYCPQTSPSGSKSLGISTLDSSTQHVLVGWMWDQSANQSRFFVSPTGVNSRGYGYASSAPGVCGAPYINLATNNVGLFHVAGGAGMTQGLPLSNQAINLLAGKGETSPKN